MMSRILVIKTGTTLPSLLAAQGDFEDWVIFGLGAPSDRISVADVQTGAPLPAPRDVAGIVITGSHSMVTDHEAWSERTAAWLCDAVEQHTPILGICYGHQLLAYALGGEVGDNPRGNETGTVNVYLNETGATDRLLGGLANPLRVHVSHQQSVLNLPIGAQLLAWSDRDQHQAFSIGDNVWGVQFHPEFNAAAVRAYTEDDREILRAEGQDPDRISAQIEETSHGTEILQRFARLTL
ncbi:MAG TPA: glutamine amidotransferase [Anaerolineae bacterium]|nr:glutamine amidotransferase [Anaerolineae bacterium]